MFGRGALGSLVTACALLGCSSPPQAPPAEWAPFDWRLQVTRAGFDVSPAPISEPSASIPLTASRWSCSYALDDVERDEAALRQFGVVSCSLAATGQTVETIALCATTAARPSDCGVGLLRVSSDTEPVHAISLGCRSAGSDCWNRPGIVEWSCPYPTAPGPSASYAADAAGSSGPQASGEPPRAHFQWKLEVGGDRARTMTLPVTLGAGQLPAPIGSWSCAYAVWPQEDAAHSAIEIGRVRCRSTTTSDTIETVVPCAESAEQPSYCNMGSLRFRDAVGRSDALMLSCKSPGNSCW